MRVPALALLATLTLCSAAAAQDYLILDPPVNPEHPVEGQPVSARIQNRNCAASEIAVVRQDNVIELRYVEGGCPILPPISDFDLPLGTLPAGTYDMRLLEVSDAAHPRLDDEAIFTVAEASCPPPPVDPTTPQLCLRGGRFSVVAGWTYNPGPTRGFGEDVKLSSSSGAFWFFSDDNYELMVKVLDGCRLNGHFWFFAAGLTDVGVDLVVTDNTTGAVKRYTNPVGRAFQPITDTSAFACP